MSRATRLRYWVEVPGHWWTGRHWRKPDELTDAEVDKGSGSFRFFNTHHRAVRHFNTLPPRLPDAPGAGQGGQTHLDS